MSIANAAHCSMMGGGKKWVNPYVTDGLICMYDGIWNAGPKLHDESTLVWKNLGALGTQYDATRVRGSWQDDGAIFVTGSSEDVAFIIPNYLMRDQMKGEWSYEVGFTPNSAWKANYHGIWGNHGNGKGIVGGQYESGTINFGLYDPSVVLYSASAGNFSAGSKCAVSQSASNTSHTANTWKNGSLVSSKSNVDVLLTFQYYKTFIGAAWGNAGSEIAGSNRIFDGVIHFLRVYNRPLSAAEVAANRVIDQSRYGIP